MARYARVVAVPNSAPTRGYRHCQRAIKCHRQYANCLSEGQTFSNLFEAVCPRRKSPKITVGASKLYARIEWNIRFVELMRRDGAERTPILKGDQGHS